MHSMHSAARARRTSPTGPRRSSLEACKKQCFSLYSGGVRAKTIKLPARRTAASVGVSWRCLVRPHRKLQHFRPARWRLGGLGWAGWTGLGWAAWAALGCCAMHYDRRPRRRSPPLRTTARRPKAGRPYEVSCLHSACCSPQRELRFGAVHAGAATTSSKQRAAAANSSSSAASSSSE